MDFDMGKRAADLRRELRDLVDEQVPEHFLGAFTDDPADLQTAQEFCRMLAERNLLCMAWPEEFGGGGASVWEQTVVREEMWAHHEPRGAQYMGVNWVGPMIMRHGTAEQQRTHLPPIAAGEVIWCQGFSEPEAGSDLASLRTMPARRGRRRLAGQRPEDLDVVRDDGAVVLPAGPHVESGRGSNPKKQQGLTIFLVPMDDPAIEVRPIGCMMGPHHLNEVFFDDLRVTEADVLGTVDQGWSIVQDVMSFERVGIARYARCERLLAAAPTVLGDRWDELPAELRGRWIRMLTHCRRARLLAYRVVALQSSGRVEPGDAAAYRIAVTKLDQDSAEVLMDIAAEVARTRSPGDVVPGRGGGPLAVLAGVHGVLRKHRDAADPAVPVAAGGGQEVILDLSDDAQEYGRQASAPSRPQAATTSSRRPKRSPRPGSRWSGPVLAELGAWDLDPRTDADGLEAAAALCRSAGYWALPYPVAERLATPADLDVDGLIVVGGDPARRHRGRARDAMGGSHTGRATAVGSTRLAPTAPAFVTELGCHRSTTPAPGTWPWDWCCRAGRCSACSTGRSI